MNIPIVFFKAYTRLGITNKPYGQKEFNTGVEHGPDAILSNSFLAKFQKGKVVSYTFPTPEEVKKEHLFKTLVKSWEEFSLLIQQNTKKGNKQVVIGGDHILTLSAFKAFTERVGDMKKIGYVHFDTHGDINLYKDSPTKNFHGMYVRAWTDRFDVAEIDALFPKKLPTENLFFIGNLELDPGEKKFFKEKHIKNFIKRDIVNNKKTSFSVFNKFITSFPYLYVTIDIDVFDKKYAPATGTPPKEGFSWNQLKPFFGVIREYPNVAFDIAEVNPKKKGSKKTILLAQHLLLFLLKQR